MKTSEGKLIQKKYNITLTELDIKLLLEALGKHQQFQWDNRYSSRATENLITKIYRCMGVKI